MIALLKKLYLRNPLWLITTLPMQAAQPTDERIKHHLQKLKLLHKHGKGKTERQTVLLFKLWVMYHKAMIRFLRATLAYERAPMFDKPSMPTEPHRPDVDEPEFKVSAS